MEQGQWDDVLGNILVISDDDLTGRNHHVIIGRSNNTDKQHPVISIRPALPIAWFSIRPNHRRESCTKLKTKTTREMIWPTNSLMRGRNLFKSLKSLWIIVFPQPRFTWPGYNSDNKYCNATSICLLQHWLQTPIHLISLPHNWHKVNIKSKYDWIFSLFLKITEFHSTISSLGFSWYSTFLVHPSVSVITICILIQKEADWMM